MRKLLPVLIGLALAGSIGVAQAGEYYVEPGANAAAGAAVGAGVGFAVGGPVGAAVGAGVGGTVGAANSPRYYRDRDAVVIRRGPATVCYRNSFGERVCERRY